MNNLRRHMMMQHGGGGGGLLPLPAEYQRVEWLQSDGVAYIDTQLFIPYKCIGETEVILSPSSSYGIYAQDVYERGMNFGQGVTWQGRCMVSFYVDGFYGASSGYSIWIEYSDMLVYNKIDMFDGTVTFNDAVFYRNMNPKPANIPLIIFRIYNPNGTVGPGHVGAKMKYLTFTDDNGSYYAYFVPCYRKADSEPGMYDLVSRSFFTNAGSSSFTVGQDIN